MVVPPGLDAASTKLLAQAVRLQDGVGADFDGDGVDEVKVEVANGVVLTWFDQDQNGSPEMLRRKRPNGDVELLFDPDEDGFPNTYEVQRATEREILEDLDRNQVHDRRRLEVYDGSGNMQVTLSHLDKSGTWVQDDQFTVTRRRAKCGVKQPGAPANGSVGPDCFDPPQQTLNRPGDVIVVYDSGGAQDSQGFCSRAHSEKIGKAVACALGQVRGCLKDTNGDEYRRMMTALGSGRRMSIDCGMICGGQAAADDSGVSFPSASLDRMSDAELCSALLHEMLHWAGTPDSGDTHGDGVDRVYACGRYCGGARGCTYTSAGATQNYDTTCQVTPAKDCAICAGTVAEKLKCGQRTEQRPAVTPLGGVCHAGLACVAGDCLDTIENRLLTCDGVDTGMLSGPCCNSCPSTCNRSNDLPCPAGPISQTTCDGTPPACK